MKSLKKQIKRNLSLALAILLMLATPMAALAVEEIPEEEAIIETEESSEEVGKIEEQQIVVEEEISEKIEEEIKQEDESTKLVAEELEKTEEQQELLDKSVDDLIYWGITDGVLRISVSKVEGEHGGSFSSERHPWTKYGNIITKVYVGDDNGVVRPGRMMRNWFRNLSNVEEINFDNIDTSNVTDMNGMFFRCINLKSLDLGCFITDKVTNMGDMFYGCSNLEILDLRNFITPRVTDMSCMFFRCSRLRTIIAGDDFYTDRDRPPDDTAMFFNCTNLVGGNGTTYSNDHDDSSYAVIDREGHPGYFTVVLGEGDDPDIPPFHPIIPTDDKPSFSSSVTSSVTGKWEYHSEGDYWTYIKNGILKNTWAYLDNPYAAENQHKSDWFYFDGTGKMLIGWQKINNYWYYLQPFRDGTGTLGACLIGPAWTPDGYEVDANGAWTGKKRG